MYWLNYFKNIEGRMGIKAVSQTALLFLVEGFVMQCVSAV